MNIAKGWTGLAKTCEQSKRVDRVRQNMDIARRLKQGLRKQGQNWGWTRFANTLTDLGMDRVANTGTELGTDRVRQYIDRPGDGQGSHTHGHWTELGLDRVRIHIDRAGDGQGSPI
jgi:hypothetical protein